jgi:hypothetical protein
MLQWGSLTRLLRRKQDHLLVEGRALLTQEQPERPGKKSVAQGELPGSHRVVVHPDGHRSTMLSCAGDFGSFVFVQELPDIDWVTATGHGVNLDLPLSSVEDESQLLDVLHELAQMGLISSSAAWSIAQLDVNWHGSGVQRFLEAVAAWRDRYQQLDRIHHTEQVVYHDACKGGFYTLTADIDWTPVVGPSAMRVWGGWRSRPWRNRSGSDSPGRCGVGRCCTRCASPPPARGPRAGC